MQDAYRVKVTGDTHIYYRSSSLTETELLVRRMKDDLAVLRQEAEARQDRLQQSIDSTQQTVTDLRHEIMVGFDGLRQQAQRLPPLVFTPQSWPQASPFHNRGFPDQKNFVGRTELLRAMKQSLDAGQDVALTQPIAMHGAGGIGKTRAAVEFARAHGGDYTLRLFLDAQSPEALRASLAGVATKLQLIDDSQASADALVLLALRLLRAVPTVLVIADNADTPAALEAVRLLCHEPGGVRWLITTRLTELGEEFATQSVSLLDEAAAVQLLQKRGSKNSHQPGSDADARTIAIELGRLPLALQQAAAYVAHQRLTWAAYNTLLANNPSQALSHDAMEMKDLPESILRTYNISLQQLTSFARRILEIAAHLAPAPIPEAVFLYKDDDGTRRAALVELADLSLIEWQTGLLEVHRAIAIAVSFSLGQVEDRRVRLELACALVKACAPESAEHPRDWPTWAVLRPHVEHLLARVSPIGVAEQAYDWLLAVLPIYLQALGEYFVAVAFYHSSIAHRRQTLGEEHPGTLSSRNNLANTLRAQGKYAEGELEHRAVLQILQRVLGAEHRETLVSRSNLSEAMRAQGKFAEAERENRERIKIEKRVLGAEHAHTLASRMNLAISIAAQGNIVEAEQELRAVMCIQERTLGADHPDTLRSRMNLATAFLEKEKFVEAELEYRAVIKLEERLLGAVHPSTLKTRMNWANALSFQGKYAEAEHEHRVILKELAQTLGEEHPDVALSRYNLALCLAERQKLSEAIVLMRQAEDVWLKVLGPTHLYTKRAKVVRQRLEGARM